MATLVPPPSKRQKLTASNLAKHQQDVPTAPPADLGEVRIQFVDRSTGTPQGDSVLVPLSQATTRNLALLVNSIEGRDEAHERIPYRFFVAVGEGGGADGDNDTDEIGLADGDDLYGRLAAASKGGKLPGTEEVIRVRTAPQAVFKVQVVSRCSAAVSGHGQPILAAQFSPASAARLATGSGDNTARVWDCDTGTPLHTLKGHTSWVLAVSWSPDGTLLATGSNDATVRLWDPVKGQLEGAALQGHTKWITSLAWEPFHAQQPGRPRLASSSKDATVRVWDAVAKRIDFALTGHKGSVSCVKWGGIGLLYTASHDKTVKVWSARNGTLVHTLSSHAHWVNHLALSTDAVLRTAFYDHTGVVPDGLEERRVKARRRFEAAAASSEGVPVERLVSASDDTTMFLWGPFGASAGKNVTKPQARLMGHQKAINYVAFSPDGLHIASAGFDNHVKLWQGSSGKFVATLRGHVGPVYQACFSADSRLLVSASKDTTLKVWEVRTGQMKGDLPGHKDEVYAVDWSADGKGVGSGGRDKQVRIWKG
ncbi:WD repeat-containing protein 5B [Lineolata rhizophorae]|uniref:WD repeat-containing protein 5B n=1 Tax=Lineolata rhizophorae TaxID=578093 RepID=A0A6A6NZH8_9PEZI|nr:WD repeat-containing protein 5B [Lineolata rhizophorae]